MKNRVGIRVVDQVTPRRLTSATTPVSSTFREKARACISVKSQPIRVHGQWDQTPSQTPPDNALSFAAARVSECVRTYACAASACAGASSRRGSSTLTSGCFFRDDARAPTPNADATPGRSNGAAKQLSVLPDAGLRSSVDFTLSTLRS